MGKKMNGAAHATLFAVWPQAAGPQAPGTSALDAALFTTHRSAPARHGTDKGKFGMKQLLSATVRRRVQKKRPLCWTDPELKHWQELAVPVRGVPVLCPQKRERIWAPRVT